MARAAATRVLIVANQTASSPELQEAVRARAKKGPAKFTLVVPSAAPGLHKLVDPEDHGDAKARAVIREARPGLEKAAGGSIKAVIGDSVPLDAVQDAINLRGFDEIIVSTSPPTVSRWLKLDLPHKLEGLGLPITTVTASKDNSTDTPVSV